MPCPVIKGNELGYCPTPLNEQMGRDSEVDQCLKVRVLAAVETVTKKLLYAAGPELARGQADVVNYQQVHRALCWPTIEVGRRCVGCWP